MSFTETATTALAQSGKKTDEPRKRRRVREYANGEWGYRNVEVFREDEISAPDNREFPTHDLAPFSLVSAITFGNDTAECEGVSVRVHPALSGGCDGLDAGALVVIETPLSIDHVYCANLPDLLALLRELEPITRQAIQMRSWSAATSQAPNPTDPA